MRLAACLVVSGMLGGVAAANPWDGTYEIASHGSMGLCPDGQRATVRDGAFSIDWMLKIDVPVLYRVGRIEGTISKGGAVKMTAKIFSPLAARTQEMLVQMGDKVEYLEKLAGEAKVYTIATPTRTIAFESGMCSVRWKIEDAPEGSEPAPSTKPAKKQSAKEKAAAKKEQAAVAKAAKEKAAQDKAAKDKAAKDKAAVASTKPAPAKPTVAKQKPRASSGPDSSSAWTPPPHKGLPSGAECFENDDCEVGECVNRRCHAKHGSPEFATGADCDFDGECASKSCYHHECE